MHIEMKIKLEDKVIRNFKVARVFRENTEKITAMDFCPEGERLVSCSKDDQIVVYDCENGILKGTINSKKYGADLVHFTDCTHNVLYSSTKGNNAIRYLSLMKKKYLRYFAGHSKRVVSLCISPSKESFISCSLDNTLRLWDFSSQSSVGLLSIPNLSTAAYDPQGVIFAVGINSEMINLYDLRSITKGPFVTFHYKKETECDWKSLKFSPDGKTILISTNGSHSRLVHAFHGTSLQTFSGHLNNERILFEASYSPDSQFVFSGSKAGQVHVWNAETGDKMYDLNANHPGPVQCVQFNPKYMLLASACTNMAFWIPDDKSWPY